tara:strand:+ start:639 stop:752 length:114 start_codon:yes stop_codon:yes gene_type:complete
MATFAGKASSDFFSELIQDLFDQLLFSLIKILVEAFY